MNFEQALHLVLNIEGGEVNNKYDPGGLTKYGISKKSYPDLDIENITIQQASAIYREDFWDALNLDSVPEQFRLVMFDSCVNCGYGEAVKFLQAALLISQDGVFGPNTKAALHSNQEDVLGLLSLYLLARYKFYASLSTFSHFGDGWVKRLMIIALHSGS